MKLTELELDTFLSLSVEEKRAINCGGIKDDGENADVALILGGRPSNAIPRARAAAQLYRDGRCRMFMPTGGVVWEHEGEWISEAELMSRILQQEGVPKELIIPENEASSTIENMIYGSLQLCRRYEKERKEFLNKIIIVTSLTHMKRSLALAKALLPRGVKISAYPMYEELSIEQEHQRYDKAFRFMKSMADQGLIEDMEIDVNVNLL